MDAEEILARIVTVGRILHGLRPWTFVDKAGYEFRVEAEELGLECGVIRLEENVERVTIRTGMSDDAPVLRLEFLRMHQLPAKLRDAFAIAGAKPDDIFPFVIKRDEGEDGAPSTMELRLVVACAGALATVYSENAESFRDIEYHFTGRYEVDGDEVYLSFPHIT